MTLSRPIHISRVKLSHLEHTCTGYNGFPKVDGELRLSHQIPEISSSSSDTDVSTTLALKKRKRKSVLGTGLIQTYLCEVFINR